MQLITKESVQSSLVSEVTKRDLPKLIEAANNAVINSDTIQGNYEIFKKLRELYMFLEVDSKEQCKPYKEKIDIIKSAYDTYLKDIKTLLEKFEPIFTVVNKEILDTEKEEQAAIDKENSIVNKYKDFVNEVIHQIILATDNKELTRIQKLIGAEKSKQSYYGDSFKIVEKTFDSLIKFIAERKDILKKNTDLIARKNLFMENGDLPSATQLMEEIEYNEQVIKENANYIAENAFSEITKLSLNRTQIESNAITPRLNRWSYRIDNPELLYKKMPHLLCLEPNSKAITSFMNEKVDELDPTKEHEFNGLVIYKKPFYVSIAK